MDISHYKAMEPFWGVWYIDSELGEGSYGKVFKIKRQDFNETYYAALKVISVPTNSSDLTRLKAEGMDEDSIKTYYQSFVKELVKEFALMSKLKGHSNIVCYEDHKIIERTNEVGWDIIIRMELLTPLDAYITASPMDEKQVLKLGIDICNALELCAIHKIIHRDIKPENVFVSKFGDFKLGDFGVARTAERTTQGMSVRGTTGYMAPEVYKGQKYNASVDIYSLGIMMYKLMNNNRGPFLPPAPNQISFSDRETADTRRFRGDKLPDAANASPELMKVIRKAAAYKYSERYSNPTEMKTDLEKILHGADFVKAKNSNKIPKSKPVKPEKEGKSVNLLAIALIVIGVIAVGIGGLIFALNANREVSNTPISSTVVSIPESEEKEPAEIVSTDSETSKESENNQVEEPKEESKEEPNRAPVNDIFSDYIYLVDDVLMVNSSIFGYSYNEITALLGGCSEMSEPGALQFDIDSYFVKTNGDNFESVIVTHGEDTFELVFEKEKSTGESYLVNVVHTVALVRNSAAATNAYGISRNYNYEGTRIELGGDLYYSERDYDNKYTTSQTVGYYLFL